jgi:hypothetical protein
MSNVPNETITIRINDCTWITNDIKHSIRKKNRHHTRAERSKSVLDWERFRHLRNECTSKIRNAKITYFDKLSEKLHDDSTSTKDWCKIAKQISNFKNKNEIPPPPIKVNDELIYDNKIKCELFNIFVVTKN